MPKSKRDIGAEILQSLREIKRGQYGRVITVPDVAKTREKTGLPQARFAQLLGVSLRTLQDWAAARLPGPLAPCSWLPRKTRKRCSK